MAAPGRGLSWLARPTTCKWWLANPSPRARVRVALLQLVMLPVMQVRSLGAAGKMAALPGYACWPAPPAADARRGFRVPLRQRSREHIEVSHYDVLSTPKTGDVALAAGARKRVKLRDPGVKCLIYLDAELVVGECCEAASNQMLTQSGSWCTSGVCLPSRCRGAQQQLLTRPRVLCRVSAAASSRSSCRWQSSWGARPGSRPYTLRLIVFSRPQPPTIPVSRISFSRVPPGMCSIHLYKCHAAAR